MTVADVFTEQVINKKGDGRPPLRSLNRLISPSPSEEEYYGSAVFRGRRFLSEPLIPKL